VIWLLYIRLIRIDSHFDKLS